MSIEHGSGNRIHSNWIERCGVGVHLWWDEDPDLTGGVYGRSQDTASRSNVITSNEIRARTTLRLVDDVDCLVMGNKLFGADVVLDLSGKTSVHVDRNEIFGEESPRDEHGAAVFRLGKGSHASFGRNHWESSPKILGEPLPSPLPAPAAANAPSDRTSTEPSVDPVPTDPRVFLRKGTPRGRKYILVDEWGPVDHTKSTVFPMTQSAVGAAPVHVLGAGVSWRVMALSDGFVAEPMEGKAPATIRVRQKANAELPSLAPFEAKIRVGEADWLVSGTLFSSRWEVRWHVWTKDPRGDAAGFAALIAGIPKATTETDGLDFAWGGGKPHDLVPADRFVTVATTTLVLPAGRWRVKTLSDDGVRVRIDGKVVLEDWTWHAPKEDAAVVELTEGAHEVVVEHFELDGHAALRCSLEPVSAR